MLSSATPDNQAVRQERSAQALAGAGHFFNHLFEPAFFVVALVLPQVFDISYEKALTLIIGGKLLMGLAAPLAGWLADRWSTVGMMALYFLGTGAAAVWVGLSQGPWEMAFALGALGLFGSIYHPVGISWLVSVCRSRGKALGINGVFGSLGPALGGIGAGALIEILGWRSAFIAPGVAVIITGLFFVLLIRRGVVVNATKQANPDVAPEKREALRAIIILMLAMLFGSLIYQSTQAALPKVFDERLHGLLGGGTLGPGAAVMLVYGFSATMQVLCGHLADRYPLKTVYVTMVILQAPVLAVAAVLSGAPLIVAFMLAVTLNTGALPAENSLVASFTPQKWRGTVFGLKFVVSFGISGLGVWLVSLVRGMTGDFLVVFGILAAFALISAAIIIPLPGSRPKAPEPAVAPAE
jgi:FSR family fosmidomycin resistance protein-like MFS transporter